MLKLKPSFRKIRNTAINNSIEKNNSNENIISTKEQVPENGNDLISASSNEVDIVRKKTKLDCSRAFSLRSVLGKYRYQRDRHTNDHACNGRDSVAHASPRFGLEVQSDSEENLQSPASNDSFITPLEIQIMELKQKYSDIILLIQNAYKYTFFGEDAEIASQVLHINLSFAFNIPMAVVPTIRLHVHLQHLMDEGYTIGVVNQSESFAAKDIDLTKEISERQLVHIFSKASLQDQNVSSLFTDMGILWGGTSATYVLCLSESNAGQENSIFGFAAFDPTTGDMICDLFEDSFRKNNLERMLEHLQPSEILAPEDISVSTLHLLIHRCSVVEKLPVDIFDFTSSLVRVSAFFTNHKISLAVGLNVEGVDMMHPTIVSCVAVLLFHLEKYGLEESLIKNGFRRFTDKQFNLQLDASVLRNLELFNSKLESSSEDNVSLYSILNSTRSPFGSRLLYDWISQPIRDQTILINRQNIVCELLEIDPDLKSQIYDVYTNLPDLERCLLSVLTFKCNPNSCYKMLQSMSTVRSKLNSIYSEITMCVSYKSLEVFISDTLHHLENVHIFMNKLNVEAAKSNDKMKLFVDMSQFHSLITNQMEISYKLNELYRLKETLTKSFGYQTLNYLTVAGEEYVIELPTNVKVPSSWRIISETKETVRYRTPEVDTICSELFKLHEAIDNETEMMWKQFLIDLNMHYFSYKFAVKNLATLDILLGFSEIAQKFNYCRPVLVEPNRDVIINISDGRHPILSLPKITECFVPNDTHLRGSGLHCVTLSGPNMGGKSCYIRQVALIVIMAHVGSFVPAKSATISILDAIYIRMGAEDKILTGKSTLMLELEDMNFILRSATSRSLVLIDELGRGTGTSDGTCIALASFYYFLTQIHCLTLFVTHYPPVMHMMEKYISVAANQCASYIIHEEGDVDNKVVLLYKIVSGSEDKCSFGFNVAKLAALPKSILNSAIKVSNKLRNKETAHSYEFKNFQNLMLLSGEELRHQIELLNTQKNKLQVQKCPTENNSIPEVQKKQNKFSLQWVNKCKKDLTVIVILQ